MEITQGYFKVLFGFFKKLQTLPDGLVKAVLLIEILGFVQKFELSLNEFKKAGA